MVAGNDNAVEEELMAEHQRYEEWSILEAWCPVAGYEGLYEVSNHGTIRRVGKAARHGAGRGGGARIGRVLTPHVARGGYFAIQLWRDGRPETRLVHRIVATSFLGPLPDGKEVNHRDGDKRNNRPPNLEYVTRSENNAHAYRIGLRLPTVQQMVAVRRKVRMQIMCGCDCGIRIETPDRKGRARRYISGHNMRRTK